MGRACHVSVRPSDLGRRCGSELGTASASLETHHLCLACVPSKKKSPVYKACAGVNDAHAPLKSPPPKSPLPEVGAAWSSPKKSSIVRRRCGFAFIYTSTAREGEAGGEEAKMRIFLRPLVHLSAPNAKRGEVTLGFDTLANCLTWRSESAFAPHTTPQNQVVNNSTAASHEAPPLLQSSTRCVFSLQSLYPLPVGATFSKVVAQGLLTSDTIAKVALTFRASAIFVEPISVCAVSLASGKPLSRTWRCYPPACVGLERRCIARWARSSAAPTRP